MAAGAALASAPGSRLVRPDRAQGQVLLGPDPHKLGGVVIDQKQLPPFPLKLTKFVGSPSITIAEDGTYVASHDTFKQGKVIFSAGTEVFRSQDKGRSWRRVSTVEDLAYATVFTSGQHLYVVGTNSANWIAIRKSADMGSTWGRAHDLMQSFTGMTPSAPAVHDGRIWLAYGGRAAMSARLGRPILSPSAWHLTKKVPQNDRWFPVLKDDHYWSEGQIVASPQTGVVLLPKTSGLPLTAMIRIPDAATATFDPDTGFVCLPGAEKKFACLYDDVSERFWALTNPVLPDDADEADPRLVRNTGALFSSPDLRTWSAERVFLYSPDVEGEAFQYFAFAIDGDDLAVVARTALEVDGRTPPRGHDANLLTFHVIRDFRYLRREQVLVADTGNDRVVRFEANLTCHLAPLGAFARRPMTKPMGIAQGPDGDVYVCEQVAGGRILRHTARGALKTVVATESVDFTGMPESLTVGADGQLFMTVAFGPNSSKIYRIDPATGRVTLLVDSSFASSAGTGRLRQPRGITIGPRGHLFVADRANDRIREFDPQTGEFLGNLTYDQRRPQALAWDPAGERLLFSRRTTDSDHDIARVRPNGRVLTLYTRKDVGLALGVASLGGRVYWTDYDNDRIHVVTSERDKKKATSVSRGLSQPGNMARVEHFPGGRLSGPCHRPHTAG